MAAQRSLAEEQKGLSCLTSCLCSVSSRNDCHQQNGSALSPSHSGPSLLLFGQK